MQHFKNLPMALAATLTGILAATISPVSVADTCKNVVFNVTNHHFEERPIEIRSVKYRNPHGGGSIKTENVANKVCNFGATCSTNGDNLADADKVDLTDIQIVFVHKNHDNTWSKEFITQPFAPIYRKCKDGKTYGPIEVIDSPNSTVSKRLTSG